MNSVLLLVGDENAECFSIPLDTPCITLTRFFYVLMPQGIAFALTGRTIDFQSTQLIIELIVTFPGIEGSCRIHVALPYHLLFLRGKVWRQKVWRQVTRTLNADTICSPNLRMFNYFIQKGN